MQETFPVCAHSIRLFYAIQLQNAQIRVNILAQTVSFGLAQCARDEE